MDERTDLPRDVLDDKVNSVFAGKVVRKDLVRKVKVGANVPVFVLEYLLGKYCASSDEIAIQMGLQVVNNTLADNYIRPDESMRAQSRVKEQGRHTFIDKVKVRLAESRYWAEVSNFGNRYVHVPERYVRVYDRLLTGGIWAQIDMTWDDTDEKAPFFISKLTPIQLATFDLDEYRPPQSPVYDRRVDGLHCAQHGLRADGHGAALEVALSEQADPPVRAQLQLGRTRTARHWQKLCRTGDLAIHSLAYRADNGREFVRAHDWSTKGHGADLGRCGLRRGR